MPVLSLRKLISATDEEYPILEYLIIIPWVEDNPIITPTLIFPKTFQAPHLRHLALIDITLPIGSRLLATAVGLVTLSLFMHHSSTYFRPNTLLQWLSFMPQLETLVVGFGLPVPNRDVEATHVYANVTPVTLPNLHFFSFQGVSTYLEVLGHRITSPRREVLDVEFFNQLTFHVPRLVQLVNTAENLRFESAIFEFSEKELDVKAYPRGEAKKYALSIAIDCWHLDWQMSSAAQISNSLGQMFFAVEHLTLEYRVHSRSSEEHDVVDRTEWRKFLKSFSNVKTLLVAKGLVKELSTCLQLEDGELALELLPELEELTYSGNGGDLFTSFIDARQDAGRPVTLSVHR
jgi:hypothetical protein